MFWYKKLAVFALILFFAVPSVSMAGSFVVSLIQGKTPAEAVQIIAEQVDLLTGRVSSLESKQSDTELEIERLKLENENLRLKNENLSQETAQVAEQVVENEKAVDAVKKCEALEKTLTCAQNSIAYNTEQINKPNLSISASVQEVATAYGVPWYAKSTTDEICFKGQNGSENCKPRTDAITQYNQDRSEARERAQRELGQSSAQMQSVKPEFESLQCGALLKKYVPNRKAPGCG